MCKYNAYRYIQIVINMSEHVTIVGIIINYSILRFSFFYGAKAPSVSGLPHYWGFTITLRHTTLGRTPLDEWSALRRYLYLTTHDTHKRQTSMPRQYSNPQSQQVSGRRLTPYSARPLGSFSEADCQHNSNRQNETIISNRCHQVPNCLQQSLALLDIEVHILQLPIIIYFRTLFTELNRFSSFLILTSFYELTASAEDYLHLITLNDTHTHTHTVG
jgi:hypothetical protein